MSSLSPNGRPWPRGYQQRGQGLATHGPGKCGQAASLTELPCSGSTPRAGPVPTSSCKGTHPCSHLIARFAPGFYL